MAWNAASDNVGVTGYRLFRNNVAQATTSQLSYTYTGLACSTNYSLSLEAYDAAGNASYRPEAVASATTSPCSGGGGSDTQPPTVPTGLSVTGSNASSLTVSWNPSTDNVGVAGYGAYRGNSLVGAPSGTSYSYTGLDCNTSYTLAIDAHDQAGNRSAKTQLSASTGACSTPPPAGGASVFMSPSGSDANPCSQAQPCRSVDRAYRVAASGTTVELAAGTYPGGAVNQDSSKSSSSDVVFRPASGAAVTISSLDLRAAHIEFRDLTISSLDFLNEANDITLRNVINRGMWWVGSSNISIIGGEITCPSCAYHPHMQNAGSTPPRNILFDGVYFHDWHSQAGEHVECLQILGGDGITIRNSTFKNCGTANGGNGATAALHLQAYGNGPLPKNILLENNFFYPSGNMYVIQGEDLENFDLRYNSLSGPILIYNTSSPGTGMDFIGNIMRASSCTAQSSSVPINWRHNIIQGGTCGPTDRNAPSGYIDPNNNLHLTPTAAAINAGDPNSYPSRDIDNQTRPTGNTPDAGADEAG
jgi:chitodextrinase